MTAADALVITLIVGGVLVAGNVILWAVGRLAAYCRRRQDRRRRQITKEWLDRR